MKRQLVYFAFSFLLLGINLLGIVTTEDVGLDSSKGQLNGRRGWRGKR